MAFRIDDIAPDFTASTTEGTIEFHDWIGDGCPAHRRGAGGHPGQPAEPN